MPEMPVLTPEERAKNTRWENVSGKALKDWVTRIMLQNRMTRADARIVVLCHIDAAGR